MAKPSLDPIYNRLKAASGYHPSTSVAFADWSVESGDIITMAKDGETYSTPVFASTMTWRGTPEMTTETTGKKKREPVAKAAERKYAGGGGYRGARETSEWVKTIEKKTGVNEMGEGGTTLYGQIVNTGDKVGMVVGTKSGKNYIKAGEIALSINETTGQTKAVIDADHVAISGNTTVSGVMEIDGSGYLKIKKSIVVSATATSDVISIGGGSVQAKNYTVATSGRIRFSGGEGGGYYDLNANIFKGMIKEASVSGNVLTLTPVYGNPINFSKATSLRGEWSSGTYTVTATPQGNTISTELADHLIDGSWSNDKKTYTGYAAYVSGESFISTGRQIVVNATTAYAAGWGDVTVTKVALADNMSPLGSNDTRATVYIQGTASNGAKKSDAQFNLAHPNATLSDGSYYVNLLQMVNGTGTVIGRIKTPYAYNAGVNSVTVDSVALASNFQPLTDNSQRLSIYIQGTASNTNYKRSQFYLVQTDTKVDGKYFVNLRQEDTGDIIGRIYATNAYNGGWKDAANAVEKPDDAPSGQEQTTFVVKVPHKTSVGSTTNMTFTMSQGTPGASGYVSVSYLNKAVGRIDVSNWYSAGRAYAREHTSAGTYGYRPLQSGAPSGYTRTFSDVTQLASGTAGYYTFVVNADGTNKYYYFQIG